MFGSIKFKGKYEKNKIKNKVKVIKLFLQFLINCNFL